MENTASAMASMEKLDHSNQAFPVSEFIDEYDASSGGIYPSHWHQEMELQIILSGSARYTVNGENYVVKKGNALYIAPNAIHQSSSLEPGTVGYNLVILPVLFTRILKNIHCEQYSLPLTMLQPSAFLISPDSKTGFSILETMRRMYYTESSNHAYELFLLQNLLGIWRSLLALFPKPASDTADSPKLLKESRMRDMLDYIHENFSQPITISQIAASASISRSECFRCFSDMSHITPMESLNQYRMFEATRQLTTTSDPITDICYAVGFNSTSYFSKEFKKIYQMTPREYRASKKV